MTISQGWKAVENVEAMNIPVHTRVELNECPLEDAREKEIELFSD
jgi:hypothetical protein